MFRDAHITGDTAQHAFIWTGNVFNGGTMTDLNTLTSASTGRELTSARGINNKGQIVAAWRRAAATFVYYALRLDPADTAVQVLIGSLGDASYGLGGGQVNSLTDKLTNAYNSIQQGLFKQATNQFNAAIKWVQTAVSGYSVWEPERRASKTVGGYLHAVAPTPDRLPVQRVLVSTMTRSKFPGSNCHAPRTVRRTDCPTRLCWAIGQTTTPLDAIWELSAKATGTGTTKAFMAIADS